MPDLFKVLADSHCSQELKHSSTLALLGMLPSDAVAEIAGLGVARAKVDGDRVVFATTLFPFTSVVVLLAPNP